MPYDGWKSQFRLWFTSEKFFDSATSRDTKKTNSASPTLETAQDGAVVVQEVRKDPAGRSFSFFKVTKSAPNTPRLKRQRTPKRETAWSSSESESDLNLLSFTAENEQSELPRKLQDSLFRLRKSEDSMPKRNFDVPVILNRASIKSKMETENITNSLKGKLPPNLQASKVSTALPSRFKHSIQAVDMKFSTTPIGHSTFRTSDETKVNNWSSNSTPKSNLRNLSADKAFPNAKSSVPPPLPGTLPRASKSGCKFDRSRLSGERSSTGNNRETGKRYDDIALAIFT